MSHQSLGGVFTVYTDDVNPEGLKGEVSSSNDEAGISKRTPTFAALRVRDPSAALLSGSRHDFSIGRHD